MKKKLIIGIALLFAAGTVTAQSIFPRNTISVNGFRNPSIGLEYQHNALSAHAGYYVTAFKSGETTKFLKAGVTYWFLPVGKKEIPSSFYAGGSYLRGLNRDYTNQNAVAFEAGFRWYAWKGLNFRLGVIALAAEGKSLKINPTPGISYTVKL